MSERKLPDGWQWVQLGKLTRLVSGGTPYRGNPDSFNGHIPWVKTLDLNFSTVYETEELITEDAFAEIRGELLPVRTVMVAMYGGDGTIGKTGILGIPATTNQAICSILPNPELFVSEFIHYWLIYIRPEWMRYSSGNRRDPNINKQIVLDMWCPLPPLSEQRRIAAILTEQMDTIEQARAAAEAELAAAEALTAAYLRAVFESEEAQAWSRVALGEVGEVISGITKGRRLPENTETYAVPYLRVANVKDGYLDLDDVQEIEATQEEIRNYQLRYGDLLLTEGGDPDKLGRGTFWEEQIPFCIHQNHIFRVRFDLKRFSPQFLSAQIGSSYGKAYFLAHAKQTTGIATINQQVLKGFPLMIPDLDLQQRIASALEHQMADVEHLQTVLMEQLTLANSLPAALLRQAFNGEL